MTLFNGLFQIAYVTRNLDRAIDDMRTRFGVQNMSILRKVAHSPVTKLDLGLAWVGDWMIEIIQSQGDGSSVYEAIAPDEGQLMRQHHLGHLLKDEAEWGALKARIMACGDRIFVEKDNGFFRYMFVDTRTTLGYFTEHILCSEEGRTMLDRVPRN